jgi:hypothetical protein
LFKQSLIMDIGNQYGTGSWILGNRCTNGQEKYVTRIACDNASGTRVASCPDVVQRMGVEYQGQGPARVLGPPDRALGKVILIERRRMHFDAVAGTLRRHVTAVADHDRIDEMLMQMIDVLEHPVL